jgi:hypothetical protein
VGESVGGEDEVGGGQALAEGDGGDEGGGRCDDVAVGQGYDFGPDGWVGRLPYKDDIRGFVTTFIIGEHHRGRRLVLRDDIVPDTDLQTILSIVGHTVPVHVFARLLHDPGQEAKLWARFGQVFERQCASSRHQSICPGSMEELIYLGMWEVVG